MRLPAPNLTDIGAGIEVSAADEKQHEAWLDVIATGFGNPDTQGVPSHEAVAGGASLRVCDGFAQLCGAATAPTHRRHGVQSALLAARLTDAARQSCDIVVVTTQPGSKYQQNVQRQGFELLYTRAILVREAQGTSPMPLAPAGET